MKKKNIKNISPAPSIPIKLKVRDIENVKKYDMDRLEDHVLFRFQPTHSVRMRKEDFTHDQVKQLETWWSGLEIDLRDSPFFPDPEGALVFEWTCCGGDDADFDAGRYGDDCE